MLFPEARKEKAKQSRSSLRRRTGPSVPRDGQKPGKAYLCSLYKRASLTVEAAAALPLFFLALLMLIGMLDIFRAQAQVTLELDSSIRELGMYAYAAEGQEGIGRGISSAACGAYAKSHLKLPENCGNLRILESSWDGSLIRLRVGYEYFLPVGFFKLPGIVLENRAQVHGWVGRQGSGLGTDGGDVGEGEEMVFVTSHGSVYHTKGDCTYLQLTIYQTTAEEAKRRRNLQGGRYHACEKCGGQGDTVYISQQGEAYHSSRSCSGLTRQVEMVKKTEAGGMRECSRCAGRG